MILIIDFNQEDWRYFCTKEIISVIRNDKILHVFIEETHCVLKAPAGAQRGLAVPWGPGCGAGALSGQAQASWQLGQPKPGLSGKSVSKPGSDRIRHSQWLPGQAGGSACELGPGCRSAGPMAGAGHLRQGWALELRLKGSSQKRGHAWPRPPCRAVWQLPTGTAGKEGLPSAALCLSWPWAQQQTPGGECSQGPHGHYRAQGASQRSMGADGGHFNCASLSDT